MFAPPPVFPFRRNERKFVKRKQDIIQISENIAGMSSDEAAFLLKIATTDVFFSHEETKELLENTYKRLQESTIPQLKKRIKYCRNLMEKKKLQQELNQAYKEQKKRR